MFNMIGNLVEPKEAYFLLEFAEKFLNTTKKILKDE